MVGKFCSGYWTHPKGIPLVYHPHIRVFMNLSLNHSATLPMLINKCQGGGCVLLMTSKVHHKSLHSNLVVSLPASATSLQTGRWTSHLVNIINFNHNTSSGGRHLYWCVYITLTSLSPIPPTSCLPPTLPILLQAMNELFTLRQPA